MRKLKRRRFTQKISKGKKGARGRNRPKSPLAEQEETGEKSWWGEYFVTTGKCSDAPINETKRVHFVLEENEITVVSAENGDCGMEEVEATKPAAPSETAQAFQKPEEQKRISEPDEEIPVKISVSEQKKEDPVVRNLEFYLAKANKYRLEAKALLDENKKTGSNPREKSKVEKRAKQAYEFASEARRLYELVEEAATKKAAEKGLWIGWDASTVESIAFSTDTDGKTTFTEQMERKYSRSGGGRKLWHPPADMEVATFYATEAQRIVRAYSIDEDDYEVSDDSCSSESTISMRTLSDEEEDEYDTTSFGKFLLWASTLYAPIDRMMKKPDSPATEEDPGKTSDPKRSGSRTNNPEEAKRCGISCCAEKPLGFFKSDNESLGGGTYDESIYSEESLAGSTAESILIRDENCTDSWARWVRSW